MTDEHKPLCTECGLPYEAHLRGGRAIPFTCYGGYQAPSEPDKPRKLTRREACDLADKSMSAAEARRAEFHANDPDSKTEPDEPERWPKPIAMSLSVQWRDKVRRMIVSAGAVCDWPDEDAVIEREGEAGMFVPLAAWHAMQAEVRAWRAANDGPKSTTELEAALKVVVAARAHLDEHWPGWLEED